MKILFFKSKICKNYEKLMINENSYTGIISVTFKDDFRKVYDKLNFAKVLSLGTEFTLLCLILILPIMI